MKYSESPPSKSKQLVEEYMLLANLLVADFLFKHCDDKTLLRAHHDISEHKKNALAKFFQVTGLKQVDLTDSLTVNRSLEAVEIETEDAEERENKLTVINRKIFQNLKIAHYVCVSNLDEEEYRHYGLNFDRYTHFTSPIRRYADLLVHRLITICLKEGEKTREKLDGLDYSEYVEQVSLHSYNARKASKACVTLFHCLLLR